MIWMRSGRKLSRKPMSAMPGRFTSETVISRFEASEVVSCSSCSSSRWSSNRRATLRDFTGALVPEALVVRVVHGGARSRPAVARGTLAIDAALVQPPQVLLEAIGGALEREARLVRLLADGHGAAGELRRDLGDVAKPFARHDDVRLAQVASEALALLETEIGERANVVIQGAVAGSRVDLRVA